MYYLFLQTQVILYIYHIIVIQFDRQIHVGLSQKNIKQYVHNFLNVFHTTYILHLLRFAYWWR